MNIKNRMLLVILAIILVILAGSLGYYLLFKGRYPFMECLYMTVIAITSVGFGEILQITGNATAEIFTMVLITFGMGIILYGLGTLTAMMIEGELSGYLKEKKMKKQIDKLKGHYIVCGGGETGTPVVVELVKNGEAVVLIEREGTTIERIAKTVDNLLFVEGDAAEDQHLITAGIARAAGVLICLPSDKDNLYVTMTARMLSKRVRIISRMISPKLKLKLRKAGADGVVSPNAIGALRMASEMIRPTVVDFLDSMLRSKQGNLRIHQITISPGAPATGKPLSGSGLKDRYGLVVLGAKQGAAEIQFNPPLSQILEPGMTLIVMGDVDDIGRAKKAF
jgi:voltage-gated potassium channel